MLAYILRRLLYMFITLIGISIISWVIITQAPGSPIALTMDPKVSPKIIEQMEKNYDLDKPVHQQYFLWLQRLFSGTLYSFKDGRPVLGKINERIWNTLLLNGVAILIIFSLAIPLGVFSARRQYTLMDYLGTFGAYLGISIPSFWLAYLLILGTVKLFGYPVLGMVVCDGDFICRNRHGLSAPDPALSHPGHRSIVALRYTRSNARSDRQDYITPRPKNPTKPSITNVPSHAFCPSSPFSAFSSGTDRRLHHHGDHLCVAED
jgi:peptide/nickel transport system permease protein